VAGYTPAVAFVDLKQLARGLAIHHHRAAGMKCHKGQTLFAQNICADGGRRATWQLYSIIDTVRHHAV